MKGRAEEPVRERLKEESVREPESSHLIQRERRYISDVRSPAFHILQSTYVGSVRAEMLLRGQRWMLLESAAGFICCVGKAGYEE